MRVDEEILTEEIFDEEIHAVDTQTPVDLDQIDVLVALDKLEEQEEQEEQVREQEFVRVTRQVQNRGMEGTALTGRLPGLLETKRERILYRTFMEIFRTQQNQLTEYQEQIEAQTREIDVLKQAFQTIVGDETRAHDESKIAA